MRYILESSTKHIINRIFKYFWLCHVKGLRERLPKHLHCQEQVSPTQITFALRFLGKKNPIFVVVSPGIFTEKQAKFCQPEDRLSSKPTADFNLGRSTCLTNSVC